MFWESKAEEKKQKTKEAKEQLKKERQEAVEEVVERKVQPIITKIEELHSGDPLKNEALQAILRDRLYQLNRYCTMQKGYTTQEDRDNFENMYDKYHRLGANGVMDKTKEKFFELPYEEEWKKIHESK